MIVFLSAASHTASSNQFGTMSGREGGRRERLNGLNEGRKNAQDRKTESLPSTLIISLCVVFDVPLAEMH